MNFWIIAGLLTLATIGTTIFPLLGKRNKLGSSLDYDREIYNARIAEIEEERRLGTISEEEHEYSLAEEGRRLLAIAASQPGRKHINSNSISKVAFTFASIAIPAISYFSYIQIGAPNITDQPLQARLDVNPAGQSVQVLLQRAENQLAKNPGDARGWLVVAPVYMRLGRANDAANAYRNAMRIQGPTPELQTSLGEALAVIAGGVVTEEAHKLFSKAAISDPDSAKPQFFLAIALNQSGKYQEAADAWKKLIKKSPAQAPWLNVARQQLQLAQTKLGGEAPANPTREDVEAASQLSKEDRQEFINSMVERLASELEENPQNKAGWRRIIRSYSVLGRKDEALAAILKAQQIFKDDMAFMTELDQNKTGLNN